MSFEYREIAREGSIDEVGKRVYKRTFQVITDDPGDGPGIIASCVPTVLWEAYNTGQELDLLARLKRKSARQVNSNGDGFFWIVECEYDTEPVAQGTEDTGSDPAQPQQTTPDSRVPTIEFGSEKTDKIVRKDIINDHDVVASNGQPFDPPLTVQAPWPTFTISCYKTIPSENFGNITTYTGSINAGAFKGFAAKKVLCTEYKLTSQFEQGAWYWKKDVSFKVNPDTTWNPVKVLDCGTFEKTGSEGNPDDPPRFRPILDPTGNPINAPVPLDGNGRKLAFGQPLVYLDFNAYREVNWANII